MIRFYLNGQTDALIVNVGRTLRRIIHCKSRYIVLPGSLFNFGNKFERVAIKYFINVIFLPFTFYIESAHAEQYLRFHVFKIQQTVEYFPFSNTSWASRSGAYRVSYDNNQTLCRAIIHEINRSPRNDPPQHGDSGYRVIRNDSRGIELQAWVYTTGRFYDWKASWLHLEFVVVTISDSAPEYIRNEFCGNSNIPPTTEAKVHCKNEDYAWLRTDEGDECYSPPQPTDRPQPTMPACNPDNEKLVAFEIFCEDPNNPKKVVLISSENFARRPDLKCLARSRIFVARRQPPLEVPGICGRLARVDIPSSGLRARGLNRVDVYDNLQYRTYFHAEWE